MNLSRQRLAPIALAAAAAALTVGTATSGVPAAVAVPRNVQYVEHAKPVQGGPGKEGEESRIAAEQYAAARTAPSGAVAPGAYDAAWQQLKSLPTYSATWSETTSKTYNADDPDYRDPLYSNSSGGAGNVTGRITGIAVGSDGTVYAGSADGGVFRSNNNGASWVAMADGLPTLSVGDLRIAPDGALWFATGEGNTGSTAYVGSGVYRLTNPASGVFTEASRVGNNSDGTNPLAGRFINKIRFDDNGNAYAATSRGLWRHSSTSASGAWTQLLNPGDQTSPYAGIINDVAVKPGTQGRTMVVNAAWRGYATYNGFYLTTDAGATFTKVNPQGAIVAKNVGNAEMAYSADGKKLYTVVEDTNLYLTSHQSGNSVLMGVFVSNSGSPAGPWTSIADYRKLANSGSALKTNNAGKGYGPGVQAWYNNFIAVDPNNADHVFVGLEEVFETTNGGSSWRTIGPYWNFGFPCWNISDAKNTCPDGIHSDQHAIAFGNGKVYVGNDGGLYARPKNSNAVDSMGHATDWQNLNANLHTLQYYSVGVGRVPGGYAVSGGLQDNGGSLLLPGASTMVSPFGGDGGDIIVDPDNGCRILDEYVYLTLWMTTNCGKTDGSVSAVKDVSVADPNPRFTAPFRADGSNKDHWVAGGEMVWTYDQGFAIDSGADWVPQYDTGAGRSITGLSSNHDVVWAGWCGGCNPGSTFARGVVTNYGGTYHQVTLPDAMPNRYISNVVVDPNDADGSTAYVVFNGFSRRWIEGPGAGFGHLWKTTNGGTTWADVSGNLPDVPADDLVVTPAGKLILGTDLGVVISTDGGAHWQRYGSTHPLTTVMDLHVGPDGRVYSATHGRGIWSTPRPA
jgi:sugar lactone lactonase YvrE